MKIRRFAGLSLVFALLLQGCASLFTRPESPIVTVTRLEPAEMGLLEQRYQLTLRVQNPNDFELPIRGLTYKLEINDEEFARGVSSEAVTVKPFGEETIKVNVTSNLLSLVGKLKNLAPNAASGLRYKISGNIALVGETFRLPFGKEGEIGLK